MIIRTIAMTMIAGLLGCGARTDVSSQRNLSRIGANITGSWKSAPFETQLGDATDVICFRSNGAVYDVLTTQGATLPIQGTYNVHGNLLFYVWSTGSKESVRFSVKDDVLSITNKEGKTHHYRRTSPSC